MKQRKNSEEAVDTILTVCSFSQTLKKSNLCGNFSLKHAPVSFTHVFDNIYVSLLMYALFMN